MSRRSPPKLKDLLHASDDESQEEAWARFVQEYTGLILHVARSLGGSHDAVMDRYAHALEGLRRDDFHRLRRYTPDASGKFTTWLTVVVRRLCLDQVRRRYGRRREGSLELYERRRRLADLVSVDLDPELLPAYGTSPEEAALVRDLSDKLDTAIQELEQRDRLILRLRFQDEVPVKEIAQLLSLPSVFHVYRRVNRILDRLRKALREAGVEGPTP